MAVSGKTVAVAAAALLLLSGDDDDGLTPPPPFDPNILDPIVVPPITVVDPLADPIVVPPITPVGPGGVEPSLVDVFDAYLTATPTQGGLWLITQGTNMSAALNAAYGRADAETYQAVTEAQYNWGLYAVAGTPGTLWSREVEDVLGTVTSAWFPMHESAQGAAQQGRLPQRLVLWDKGSKGQVQPRAMGDLPHPLAGLTKGYGTMFFPKEEAFGLGRMAPGKNPIALFNRVGLTPETWDPWAS